MGGSFADVLEMIDKALGSGDLSLADRLLHEAVEVASSAQMILGDGGRQILVTRREGSAASGDPAETIELGIMLATLIEDSGHKSGRQDIVEAAQSYLSVLMRYAEAALRDPRRRAQALGEGLLLEVQAGAMYGASVVAEAVLEPSKSVSTPVAMTMHNNAGAIQARLGDLRRAAEFYRAALALGTDSEPPDIARAIRTNLDGLATGYDPDFLFLPEFATDLTSSVLDGSASSAAQASPLAEAARGGEFDRVLALLSDASDVDATDEYGGTALMYAVAAQREDVIRTLLARGANPRKPDADGRCALDYATVFACPDSIVALLARP